MNVRTIALSGLLVVTACGDDSPKKDAEVADETTPDGEVGEADGVEGEAVVQINGNGPFDVTYVDPKDDPRNN